MLGPKKLWGALLCLVVTLALAAPGFAADPEVTAKDLKGVSAKRHRYLFSVLGGAAVGAGVGVLVGSGGDVVKGLMLGGGGASTAWLHSNRREQLGGWRNWAMLGSHTVLGGGVGWTLCGCDDGLVAGTLIGGGASAIWQASQPSRRRTTAIGRP